MTMKFLAHDLRTRPPTSTCVDSSQSKVRDNNFDFYEYYATNKTLLFSIRHIVENCQSLFC